MRAPPFQAIEPRLAAKSSYIPFCGCRIWFGPSVPRGYGVISVNGRQTYAHRAAWLDVNGTIPIGMFVLHSCDIPACVNVNHLFLGTAKDNSLDMVKKGRGNYINRAKGKDHFMSSGGYKGEDHPRRKLYQSDVDLIRQSYLSGSTQTELAIRFGVSQSQISSITRGKSWV